MKIIKKYYPVFFIALLCAVIIAIWFKDGKLLATGEEGLMLVNPSKSIELYKYSWNEVGTGISTPGANPILPLFYFESYVLKIGVPVWQFQVFIFYLLLVIGSISMYLLTRELFKSIGISFIAAIFYILNPISFLGIWYRFLLAFMFFYALAPLFLYLYIIGLNNRKIIFIILAPLITLFFTFAFEAPALVLLLWFLPFMYSLILSWPRSLKQKFRLKIFPLIYFNLCLSFWIIINLWWIFPYIELSKIAFSTEIDPIRAVNTLKGNSVDFTIDNVIRLIHGGFLYRNEDFGSIYKTPFFLLLSWLIPIITIYGLVKLKGGRIKIFFASSLILLLFLVKGISPPFGEVFLWFFSKITILQLYRNPLEKIGMLLPIIYAPLFSFGFFYLLSKIHNFKIKRVLLLSAILGLVINTWPFFTGAIVSYDKRDIRVEIPSSFQNANQAIPADNHVILSVPVMGGASGFYKWQYGYKGVESSEYLFNYPVINIFYDANSFYGQLLIGVSNGNLNNLVGLAQLFSADIVAYRKDTDIAAFGYNLDALERSEKMISEVNLSKIFDSKEFSLWSLPKDKVVPIIYTPQAVRLGDSPAELISLLEENKFDPKTETFICVKQENCKPYKKPPDQSMIEIETIPEKVEFTKVSPVNYEIKVYNSKGRFLLVFNNSYHPGWVVFVGDNQLPSDRHIVANGYANGFMIDDTGSFNISLKFAPGEEAQRFYKVSLLAISLGTIILFGLIIKILLK